MAGHVSHASRGFTLLAFLVALPFVGAQTPPATPSPADSLEAALEVQYAIASAKAFLNHNQPKSAVEELEKHVAKANGQGPYLELLRDSYRAYIKYLLLTSQPDLAQRYVQRLMILDPSAANDPSLQPGATRNVPALPAAATEKKNRIPNFDESVFAPKKDLVPVKVASVSKSKAPIIRSNMPQDDPFDLSNRSSTILLTAATPAPATQAAPTITSMPAASADARVEQILSQANAEFDGGRYAMARPPTNSSSLSIEAASSTSRIVSPTACSTPSTSSSTPASRAVAPSSVTR